MYMCTSCLRKTTYKCPVNVMLCTYTCCARILDSFCKLCCPFFLFLQGLLWQGFVSRQPLLLHSLCDLHDRVCHKHGLTGYASCHECQQLHVRNAAFAALSPRDSSTLWHRLWYASLCMSVYMYTLWLLLCRCIIQLAWKAMSVSRIFPWRYVTGVHVASFVHNSITSSGQTRNFRCTIKFMKLASNTVQLAFSTRLYVSYILIHCSLLLNYHLSLVCYLGLKTGM